MIDHTGITVRNLEKSKAFYTKALGALGYVLCMNSPEVVSFGLPTASTCAIACTRPACRNNADRAALSA